MWWKIYFWIIFILTLIGMFALLQYAPFGFYDIFGTVINIFMVIATYSYVFKKKIVKKEHLKIIFASTIFLFIIDMLELYVLPTNFLRNTLPFLVTNIEFDKSDILLAWVISLPS